MLVESYIEGFPITNYESRANEIGRTIAKIIASTFFEMLFKYNFVHADFHSGNFIVKVSPQSFAPKFDFLYQAFRFMEDIVVKLSSESVIAKELYLQSRLEEDKCREILRGLGLRVDVTLIDAGMVIEMAEQDRHNFAKFIRSVVKKEPEECAQMIYSLSLKGGKRLPEGV